MCRGKPKFLPLIELATNYTQDAALAAEAGVDGVLISNHGGKLVSRPLFLLFNR
jgi:isopentenyl diphosphate isomerase/L-lactate dehydrogenase-like FMN-dependent dehydrogenase